MPTIQELVSKLQGNFQPKLFQNHICDLGIYTRQFLKKLGWIKDWIAPTVGTGSLIDRLWFARTWLHCDNFDAIQAKVTRGQIGMVVSTEIELDWKVIR